jgi:hypothetical protein
VSKLRLERPLPLIVGAADDIYELRTKFDTATQQWRIAIFKVGDGFAGWLTRGRMTHSEFVMALESGIEIVPLPDAELIASELAGEGRAQVVQAV